MRHLVMFVMLSLLFSCTDPDRARKTLVAQGFTNVKTTGYSLECSGSDDTCTGFSAISPSGQKVKGTVGCGFNTGCSKGCTVRLNF